MVAGFIGAIPNNSQGVAGIAYGTTILPISFAVNNLGGHNIFGYYNDKGYRICSE